MAAWEEYERDRLDYAYHQTMMASSKAMYEANMANNTVSNPIAGTTTTTTSQPVVAKGEQLSKSEIASRSSHLYLWVRYGSIISF